MNMRYLIALTTVVTLSAQQSIAPTEETVGEPRGTNIGNYNITDSVELGYRLAIVDGSLAGYRSNVNYGNGIRLLGSSFTANSKDGHGRFFDSLSLTTQGLGNDPYQSAMLRVEKNQLYRYDMTWRLTDYYNPGLVTSFIPHLQDTQRRIQSHDLLLLPKSLFKVRLGYSRNQEDGPALTGVQGVGGGEQFALPLFSNVRRDWNEYRVGGDLTLAGFRFTVMRRWSFYKDDPSYVANLTGSTATQFSRTAPYRGKNPAWLGNLNTNRKYWAMNARFTYVGGSGDFAFNESSTVPGRGGALSPSQMVVAGTGRRPASSGDLNFTFFPIKRVTLSNNSTIDSNRIDGNAVFLQYNNITAARTSQAFDYLGIRTLTNSSEARYEFAKWLTLSGGYNYSNRLITTITSATAPGFGPGAQPGQLRTTVTNDEQKNQQREGLAKLILRPITNAVLQLDAGIGRNDHPFLPISDQNYHTLGGRASYKLRNLQLSSQYRQVYNVNSPGPITMFSSRSRSYTANANYALGRKLSLDVSYMKLHLDTASGINFFSGTTTRLQLTSGYQSVYISNIHAVNTGIRLALISRTDLYLGYSLTRDAGDGRASLVPSGTAAVPSVLASVQTFPLNYQTPLMRLSVRITPKLRWNAGWQPYFYRQDFSLIGVDQNYHANTGYTSLQWSF